MVNNSECRVRLQSSECRMQKSCPKRGFLRLVLFTCVLRQFYAFPPKLLEAAQMRISPRRCIHSSAPLRIRTSTAILQPAPSTAECESTEASLQSSTATSEFRLGSEVEVEVKRLHFRMQNAECRVRKKMKWDSVNSNSDFDFRAGL